MSLLPSTNASSTENGVYENYFLRKGSSTQYYGLKGTVSSGSNNAWLWFGTQQISGGTFPDPGTPPAYYRVDEPTTLAGLSVGVNIAPGSTNTVTFLVQITPIATGILTDTAFTLTLTGTQKAAQTYGQAVGLATGDLVHLKMSYTGASGNQAHDVTAQINMY
jgi:hypothetical protein